MEKKNTLKKGPQMSDSLVMMVPVEQHFSDRAVAGKPWSTRVAEYYLTGLPWMSDNPEEAFMDLFMALSDEDNNYVEDEETDDDSWN
jgi:hypothetical protein